MLFRSVEPQLFGGLENAEIADALGVSLATVKRDWALARAWRYRELGGGAAARTRGLIQVQSDRRRSP